MIINIINKRPEELELILNRRTIQAYLGDTACLVLDHHSKVSHTVFAGRRLPSMCKNSHL